MGTLKRSAILDALSDVAQQLRSPERVELVIVGGAAAVLTGLVPPSHATEDVDALAIKPDRYVDEVLTAAMEVGRRRGLPGNWLSIEAGLFGNELPQGWETRRVLVGDFPRLAAYAIGRQDLIAMKFVAHRTVDRAHLHLLHVTAEDAEFVRRHIARLRTVLPAAEHSKLDMAESYINNWQVQS